MMVRRNSLLVGGVALLVITSLTLGLFIGLLEPVEIQNDPINGSFYSPESRSKYFKVVKSQITS